MNDKEINKIKERQHHLWAQGIIKQNKKDGIQTFEHRGNTLVINFGNYKSWEVKK